MLRHTGMCRPMGYQKSLDMGPDFEKKNQSNQPFFEGEKSLDVGRVS